MKELERLQGHEKITETVKADLAKKKAVYEKRLALITLILQKPTLKKERRIVTI